MKGKQLREELKKEEVEGEENEKETVKWKVKEKGRK